MNITKDNIIEKNLLVIMTQVNLKVGSTRGIIDVDVWDILATLILCAVASAALVGLSYAISYLMSGQAIISLGTMAGLLDKHQDKVVPKIVWLVENKMPWLHEKDAMSNIKELHLLTKKFLQKHFLENTF